MWSSVLLQVNVAERPSSRAHQVLHLHGHTRGETQVDGGLKGGVGGWGHVQECAGARDTRMFET